MHVLEAGAQDLGDVGRVAHHHGDGAQHGLVDATEQAEARDAEANEIEHHDHGDAAHDGGVEARHHAQREHDGRGGHAHQGERGAQDGHSDERDAQHADVEPETFEHLRPCLRKVLGREERLLDARPAWGVLQDDDHESHKQKRRDDAGEMRAQILLAPVLLTLPLYVAYLVNGLFGHWR